MALLDFFKKKSSGTLAKDRLKLVLISDRANCSPDVMENIKNDIIYSLSPNEQMDIVNSIKNETVISKLIMIGKRYYAQNPSEEMVYMVALSVGTIIKEYGWGTYFVMEDGLYELARRIISN